MEESFLSQNKTFLTLYLADFFSALGSSISFFSVGLFFLYYENSTFLFALIAFSQSIPYALLSFFNGILSDKINRYQLMLIGHTGAACCTLTLMALFSLGLIEAIYVVPVVFLGACFISIINKAFLIELPNLVVGEKSKAIAVTQGGMSIIFMLSPFIAAFFVVQGLIEKVFIADVSIAVLAFIITFSVSKSIAHKVTEKPVISEISILKELSMALRFLKGNTLFLSVLMISILSNVIFAIVQLMATPFVLTLAGNKSVAIYLGVLSLIAGIGLLSGSFLMFRLNVKEYRLKFMITMFQILCLIIAMGFMLSHFHSVSFIFLCLGAFSVFLLYTAINNCVYSFWYEQIPSDILGRVEGLFDTINKFSFPISFLVAGFLMSTVQDILSESIQNSKELIASSIGYSYSLVGVFMFILGILMYFRLKRLHFD